MSSSQPQIRAFDPMTAADSDFEAIATQRNVIQSEATPDDPPTTAENLKLQMQNIPPVYEVIMWAGWEDDRVVAWANLGIPHTETNQHVAQFDISVLPAYRRKGLATQFLQEITRGAEKATRRLLVANTNSTVPAGENFLEAIGGSVGLSTRRNDLLMAELDRNLVTSWIARAQERASGYEIVEFIGPYPESELGPISKMQLAINAMPTDDLDVEDFEFTPEQLKQMDDAMVAQGNDRWSLVAREKATGNYVGWTDVMFNPRRPTFADVGGTAVAKEYQNLGLGRWLKAAILDKVAREKPEVVRIRTGNAHSNAPMLKINDELGFRPALTMNLWQVELDKVNEFLESRSAAMTPTV